MYFMILLILDKLEQCPSVLEAWDATGAGGITILDSTGYARVRKSAIRDDLPLMPSISSLFKSTEEQHRTIFTVVHDEAHVDRIIKATQEITGDLNEPDTGVLFVLPVSRVVGFHGAHERGQSDG